jgi:hypothetical protein
VKLDVHFCGFRTLFFCGGGSFVIGHISLIFQSLEGVLLLNHTFSTWLYENLMSCTTLLFRAVLCVHNFCDWILSDDESCARNESKLLNGTFVN